MPMKTYVMVPTYNERENIATLIDGILSLGIRDLHIVVVDDDSPDGTSRIVKGISKSRKNVHLLLRTKNRGRGNAGRDGYLYCLAKGADVIIEMDADLSHDPKYIPVMLEEIKKYDMVLGSRMVKGGQDVGRGPLRRLITKGANFYITLMLGIPVKDCNSGYRCFRREILEKIDPNSLRSSGPAIVQEVLFRAHLRKARVKEIPIVFVDRAKGKSKLGVRELGAGYTAILKLKWEHLTGKLR